jgi:DNA invertase Pin-like site-specific DNA recombinase
MTPHSTHLARAHAGVRLAGSIAGVEMIRSVDELYDDDRKVFYLEIVALEVDRGESAKDLHRPAIQRALRLLKARKADALLVVKLDRLTRSLPDLATLVGTYFTRGADLLSVNEQIDTRSAAGRMMMNVLTAVASWEREVIAERTKAGMDKLRHDGRSTGGLEAPLGYRKVPDPDRVNTRGAPAFKLEPIPEEQAVIARARGLAETGMTVRAIAATLAEAGVTMRGGMSPGRIQRVLARA